MADRWDDPHCLIEAYFAERCYGEHEPDTVVIAWLSVLPADIEPALAARSLMARLKAAAAECLSVRQRRLLDLLLYVSRHGRTPPGGFAITPNGHGHH
jgi:predicted oxidoreductase